MVGSGQTANFHIGDKYPIAQTLYTGFQASRTPSIYNPVGQITIEDLGIILKMTPRVNGDGDISLDLEADYKSLGTQTFNTIPAIAEREFKGSIIDARRRNGRSSPEWTSILGASREMVYRPLPIPGLGQILSENTRETRPATRWC